MSKADNKTERYAGGTIRAVKYPHGLRYNACTYITGECRRARFQDRESARTWLEVQSTELPTLGRFDIIDAARAKAKLPHGATLFDAVQFYVDHHKETTDITIGDGLSAWLESRRVALRPATLAWYTNIATNITNRLGISTLVSSITSQKLDVMLVGDKPSVRNATIRTLSAFLAWCEKTGYIKSNPAANLSKSKLGKTRRTVLTLEQARNVLDICTRNFPHAVPYFAIGMFAGVRPFETLRLTLANFSNNYIRIDASIAKTASGERTIPIRPNLEKWLSAFPISKSEIYPSDAPYKLDWCVRSIFKRAGIEDHKDILRHSFASYLYDMTNSADKVAAELGHTTTSMLFRHYRGLVTPGDGEKYFAIIP